MSSKFYTLGVQSIRLSAVTAVSTVSEDPDEPTFGFAITFLPEGFYFASYDGEDMACAQRAKFMEALENSIDG